jgi:hypothetical protein
MLFFCIYIFIQTLKHKKNVNTETEMEVDEHYLNPKPWTPLKHSLNPTPHYTPLEHSLNPEF